jgi:protein-tyrosine phosphatase
VIDLHCHILPGIDDGASTLEDSVAIARAAAASGTRTMVATPHVSWRFPNDSGTIARLVQELQARLISEQIALELRPGAELAMTELSEIEPARLRDLGLGGGPWLLVEPPFADIATGLDTIVRDLLGRGHRVMLAHTERCPAFQRNPQMLRSLLDEGVLSSITAGSLVGRFGVSVKRFALQLLQNQLVHNVASDAHDDQRRPPGMADELEQAGFAQLTAWFTESVPEAILAGREIPPRPAVSAGDRRPRSRPGRRGG